MTAKTSPALSRVIDATRRFLAARSPGFAIEQLDASTAVCQDALIFGVEVDDYVDHLGSEFGAVVYEIPWLIYTDQTSSFRGYAAVFFFPFWIIWRSVRRGFVRGPVIPRANPKSHSLRLELGHIAAVIDRGEWFEP